MCRIYTCDECSLQLLLKAVSLLHRVDARLCLEGFLPQVSITPALVQNEIHPYYQEREDVEYCHVTEDTLFTEMEKFEAGSQNDINVPNGVKVV